MIYETTKELMIYANKVIDVPFKDLDKKGRLQTNKGGIGLIIEDSHFGIPQNNKADADIAELGIELKVTPFVKHKKNSKEYTYRAKERLVLNIINYMEENLDSIYDSSFWKKNQKILMMFYEHNYETPKDMWYIADLILFEWIKKDFPIILNDWLTIANKIKSGKAHELSESDTMYLAACTKGASSESMRPQPFSDIKAKQRAYSCLW